MANRFRKIFKFIKRLFYGFLILLILYFVSALVFSLISANKGFKEAEDAEVDVFLRTNGVHLDIVLPIVNKSKDWSKDVEIAPDILYMAKYVGFGWGDKGFFLNTPDWKDIKMTTALKATFLPSASAMHITYYQNLIEGKECRHLKVSEEQYLKLTKHIEDSFERDASGKTLRIDNKGYGNFDMFYEANRSYNLFYTCNTWTNQALKQSGLPSCMWTPFDRGILYHYKFDKY